jgi:hypothetical protein
VFKNEMSSLEVDTIKQSNQNKFDIKKYSNFKQLPRIYLIIVASKAITHMARFYHIENEKIKKSS